MFTSQSLYFQNVLLQSMLFYMSVLVNVWSADLNIQYCNSTYDIIVIYLHVIFNFLRINNVIFFLISVFTLYDQGTVFDFHTFVSLL